jgi:hypothetical protein
MIFPGGYGLAKVPYRKARLKIFMAAQHNAEKTH